MATGALQSRPPSLITPDPEEPYRLELWTELIMHAVIQGEQLLLLFKKLSPYGGLDSDDVLIEAAQAAQRRIARGHDPEVDGTGT